MPYCTKAPCRVCSWTQKMSSSLSFLRLHPRSYAVNCDSKSVLPIFWDVLCFLDKGRQNNGLLLKLRKAMRWFPKPNKILANHRDRLLFAVASIIQPKMLAYSLISDFWKELPEMRPSASLELSKIASWSRKWTSFKNLGFISHF